MRAVSKTLMIKNIFSMVTDTELVKYYFGINPDEAPKPFNSLFRVDNNPSCVFFRTNKGYLRYHDFALCETYDVIGMIKKKLGLSLMDTLLKINEDLELGLIRRLSKKELKEWYRESRRMKKKKYIQVRRREWMSYDKKYWRRYNLDIDDLDGVIPVQHVFIDTKLTMINTKTNPIYAYTYPDDEKYLKIYRPLARIRRKKWLSAVPYTVLEGIQYLPSGTIDTLIITKSRKDVMVLRKMGYHAIAPAAGESIKLEDIPSLKAILSRSKRTFIFYDEDVTGRKISQQKANKLGLQPIFTGDPDAKDISDYVAKYGWDKGVELISNLINNYDDTTKD